MMGISRAEDKDHAAAHTETIQPLLNHLHKRPLRYSRRLSMTIQFFLPETSSGGFVNAGVPDAGLVARVYIAGPSGLYRLADLNVNSFLTTTMVSALSSLALLYAARWLKDVDLAASPWPKMIYNSQHGVANATASAQYQWIGACPHLPTNSLPA